MENLSSSSVYDLLIWGHSPAAVLQAALASEQGLSVCLAAPDAFLGGQMSSALALRQRRPSESFVQFLNSKLGFKVPSPDPHSPFLVLDPEEIKFNCHRYLIDAKVDILFYIKPFSLEIDPVGHYSIQAMAREGQLRISALSCVDFSSEGDLYALKQPLSRSKSFAVNVLLKPGPTAVDADALTAAMQEYSAAGSDLSLTEFSSRFSLLRLKLLSQGLSAALPAFQQSLLNLQQLCDTRNIPILVYPSRMEFCSSAEENVIGSESDSENRSPDWPGASAAGQTDLDDLLLKAEKVCVDHGII